MVDIKALKAILSDHNVFMSIALENERVPCEVIDMKSTDDPRFRTFITEIHFPKGYVEMNFAKAFVRAFIIHEDCSGELGADYSDKLDDELRETHFDYFDIPLDVVVCSYDDGEGYAVFLKDHCKNTELAQYCRP